MVCVHTHSESDTALQRYGRLKFSKMATGLHLGFDSTVFVLWRSRSVFGLKGVSSCSQHYLFTFVKHLGCVVQPQHTAKTEPPKFPNQIRNKSVARWLWQKSVVSVVSCRFSNSITTTQQTLLRTCYGLVSDTANNLDTLKSTSKGITAQLLTFLIVSVCYFYRAMLRRARL